MGDVVTLLKARQELEDLYLGVPDDSVDLTFKDFANVQHDDVAERKISNMEPICEGLNGCKELDELPSLDFGRALQEAKDRHGRVEEKLSRRSHKIDGNKGVKAMAENSQVYDDVSAMSMACPSENGGTKRRLGIPHTNICTLCSDYIYISRHRCLVCGRVYCRKCVGAGMGEMPEGRKCVECLGRRFSQRYIGRAGKIGCCWRYPSIMKQHELKWAEKGPRRSGEKRYGRSDVLSRSRSRSPMPKFAPRSPVITDTSTLFVMSSTFSTASPHIFPI